MVVLILGATLAGCATTHWPGFSRAPLFGMLYDAAHRPCSGAEILLDDREAISSDTFGRFLLEDVSQGSHQITVRKQGYATRTESIDFQSRTQVLYVRMESYGQLIAQAEQAIERRELSHASELLLTARGVDPKGVEARYLTAILALRQGSVEESKEMLLGLIADGVNAPAVSLLLADVYAYYLQSPDAAMSTLKRSFDETGDPTVKRRLEEMTTP